MLDINKSMLDLGSFSMSILKEGKKVHYLSGICLLILYYLIDITIEKGICLLIGQSTYFSYPLLEDEGHSCKQNMVWSPTCQAI